MIELTKEVKIAFVAALFENAFKAMDELPDPAPRLPGHTGMRVIDGRAFTNCYHSCPYFELDGGPSPMMVCGHPSLAGKGIEEAAIISHPDCDKGFPALCPLFQESQNSPLFTSETASETGQ